MLDADIKKRATMLIDERQNLITEQMTLIERIDSLTGELESISQQVQTRAFEATAAARGLCVFDVTMVFPPTRVPLKVIAVDDDDATSTACKYFDIIYGDYACSSDGQRMGQVDVADLDDAHRMIVNAVIEGTSSIAKGMPRPEFEVVKPNTST